MRMSLIAAVALGALASPAAAQYGTSQNYGTGYTNPQSNQSRGYIKRDGGYVAPHQRTNPNSTRSDNYSTQGNTNPWTGKQGTRNPW